ncbi:MAG: protein kinase, partial [Planctomycetes bacterium]|nr:protein kinase [Planctomycetota bacterium]
AKRNPGASGSAQDHDQASLGVLGDYTLRREIGRGGMGTVYEAWQQSLQRTIALKVLSRQVSSSPTAVARFQREAQAAAKLHHIHIVPIFALGEQKGTYYYAMELIEGQSVNELIVSRQAGQQADTATIALDETVALDRSPGGATPPVPTKATTEPAPADDDTSVSLGRSSVARFSREHFVEIAGHIADVADALDYAHRNGVIHRDIKPHNLLLGNDGRLRISDFGLARLAEQPGVTMTGELLGSPLYMSPEQLSGDPHRVHHGTDIYSLGATLYEWMTLKPPYPGDTRERVISRILTSEMAAPRTHNEQIPVDLETICLKAMERDPARRYRSGGEFRDDLRRFIQSLPIRAKRAGWLLRAGRFIHRHQLASLSTAAAVVLLAFGGAWLGQRGEVQQQSQAVADLQEKNEQLLDLFSVLPLELGGPLRMAGAVQAFVDPGQPGQPASPESADLPMVGTPAAIAGRLALAFYAAAAHSDPTEPVPDPSDEPSKLLREAARIWPDNAGKAKALLDGYLTMRPDDYDARCMRAAVSGQMGRFSQMLEDAQKMVILREASADAYVWRGLAFLLLDQVDHSLDDLTRATQLDDTSPWAKIARGLALIQDGRAGGAILDFEDALREQPDSMLARLGRAGAYYSTHRNRLALADTEHVLAKNPDDVDALTIRGDCYSALGDLDAAARDYERGLNIAGRDNAALAFRYLSVLVQQQQMSKSKNAESDGKPGAEVKTGSREPPDGSTQASPVERFLRSVWQRLKGDASGSASGGGVETSIHAKILRPRTHLLPLGPG